MKTKLRTHDGIMRLTFQPPGYDSPIELPVITKGTRNGTGCWSWNGDREKPTLRPSIKTQHGKWHGEEGSEKISHLWLNDGKCQFLSDSTDGNAGQTLPLLDLDTEVKDHDAPPPLTGSDLWAVYISGMDEYQACRDKAHAEELVNQLTKLAKDYGAEKELSVKVAEWPFGEKEHAEDIPPFVDQKN